MKISVITPLLDGIRFLPDLIASISNQTHPDWEHVIVDGGSTDGSLQAAEDWSASEPRAHLLSEPGLGLYPSIFRGLGHATGDILCWLNCDDIYAPWSLATVAEHHERTGAQWMTGLPGAWDAAGRLRYVRPYGHYPTKWIRKGWFHNGLLGHLQQESMFFSSALFKRLSAEQREEICSLKLAGDYLLWRYLAGYANLSVIPSALAGFRFHETNRSRSQAALYEDEVRATGAPFPGRRVAGFYRRVFHMRAALSALDRVNAADQALASSLKP